jgi:hypothetical protein
MTFADSNAGLTCACLQQDNAYPAYQHIEFGSGERNGNGSSIAGGIGRRITLCYCDVALYSNWSTNFAQYQLALAFSNQIAILNDLSVYVHRLYAPAGGSRTQIRL